MAAILFCNSAAFSRRCSSAARDWGSAVGGTRACLSAGTCNAVFQQHLSSWIRASSTKKNQSKIKRKRSLQPVESKPESLQHLDSSSTTAQDQNDNAEQVLEELRDSLPLSGRRRILRACVVTSAGISGAGVLLRQVSHWAADSGFPVPDCTVVMPYTIDQSQVGVVAFMVVVVSLFRQLLLWYWPDFRQASTVSNEQILGPLQPIEYVIVSALPGISEELLFRGALLPLVGMDWKGAAVAGLLFGAAHLSGGRNAAFAIWASAVGTSYGLVSVFSQSLVVPMAIHSLANLMSITIWRSQRD